LQRMLSNYRFIILLSALTAVSALLGLGFRISPGTILVYDAPVGRPLDFAAERNQTIRIGPTESDITYELHAEQPSAGNSTATGYYDFPEPAWFSFAVETVFVRQNEVAEIPMWLDLPQDDALYNHNWLLGVPVSPIAVGVGASQIQVGGYLLFRIETEPKDGVVPSCAYNEIVSVPSKLFFQKVKPGAGETATATLFHGKPKSMLYSVERLDPESDVAKITILGMPGYKRLENPEWIEYPSEIVIPGIEEGGGPLPIRITIPENTDIRRFEEILLIKNPDAKTAFIRILVDIDKI